MQNTWKIFTAIVFAVALPCLAQAQTSPNLTYGQVLTPAQWNTLFASKQDYLGNLPLLLTGGTMTGPLITAPSLATQSGLNIPPGVAPTAPNNGDFWSTSAGFFGRVNGATVGPFSQGTSGSFTGTAPIVPSFPGGGVVNYAISNGVSVANPGTGTLEGILPPQTVTGSSKTYATADLFKKTRRSNSGSAMSDTFPASTATGMVNGTRVVVANADATATITITAGAGTVMASGGSTDTVGPGRDVAYEYDLSATQWRRAYNTGTALLGPNNLSDLSSVSTARTNLGLATLYSVSAVSHQWINSVAAGVPNLSQPAFSDLSGAATGSQLPTPGASSLGGVQSKACTGGQFLLSINTDGTETCSTPSGGGNVSNSGTPVANQIAQWTGPTTIQGVNLASLLTPTNGVTIASVDNFLPNVQWQLWSGVAYITKQNNAGTGSQTASSCSSFSTATQTPTINCANTQQIRVNDLVTTSIVSFWGFTGAGYITCSNVNCDGGNVTASRVTTVGTNSAIVLTSPGFSGVSPASSSSVTLTPIAPGDLGSSAVGADGWSKASTLIATIDDWGSAASPASTVYPGCERPLLLRKGVTGNEPYQWSAGSNQVARFRGQTITFGVVIYQRVQGGASTFQTFINDNTGATASAAGTGASLGGYQFLTVTRTIASNANQVSIGIQTEGNTGDVFDVCLPTAAFVPSMVQSQLKQNSGEIIRATGHWNPPLMTPYIISFPSTFICSGCGLYGYNGNDMEALSFGTVHNSVGNIYGKLEWTSTTVGASVFVGDNVNLSSLTFGLQAATQVSGVTFPTSITRMPLFHDGTFAIYTGTSGLVPTSGTFDFTDVDTSPPTSAN